MSDTNGGPAQAPGAGAMPQLMVLAQYTKDLSFENPNAPQSLGQNTQPQINITVNVGAKQLGGTDFEVVTTSPLELKAVEEGYEEDEDEEEEETEYGDYS